MKKLKIMAISLVCVILAGCGNGAKQKEQEINELTYATNLNTAATEMLIGAAYSETLCNKASSVWHDAIFDETNSKTIKYMRDPKTNVKLDFNGALNLLYEDEAVVAVVDKLKENKQKVEDLMSKLSSPPEKYTICYNTITELYKTYSSFVSMAITPTGSYKDYMAKFAQLDNDFNSTHNLIETQLPDIASTN